MADQLASVDDYIASFTGDTRTHLTELRELIRQILPEGQEGISYSIPAYRLDGVWAVYFAGFAKHVSLTLGGPLGAVAEVFADDLRTLKTSVSAIQFQNDEPLPRELIARILQYRRDTLTT